MRRGFDCCRPVNPPAEASVRPGINADLLKPDLNVTQWVERFEKEGREIYDGRQRIVDALKIQPGSAIADIGAGTGLFTPMLARSTGPKGRVFAVDIVAGFLRLIDERARVAGLTQVQTVLGGERSVNLSPGSVDLAFICDTYHHFEYPSGMMRSLHSALRPRGEVVVIDFRRVPGQSSAWVLEHVRAGQEVATQEIEAAGFERVEEQPLLKDNYFIRFRKRSTR